MPSWEPTLRCGSFISGDTRILSDFGGENHLPQTCKLMAEIGNHESIPRCTWNQAIEGKESSGIYMNIPDLSRIREVES
jgi:hypothetical protein